MNQRFAVPILSAAFLAAALVAAPARATTHVPCESLAALHLPDTTLALAEEIAGPEFTPPGLTTPLTNLPAFCRVRGAIKPQAESNIQFEVWLPLMNWNGKYNGVGNGGFAGSISFAAMANALRRGYATASTDTGHVGGGAVWALGRPDLIADFGYRSLHETTVKAKIVIRAFYGKRANYSYYTGCSKGGQQALAEAQRFPADFDGIVAGAPANNWTRLFSGFIHNEQALLNDPESWIPPSKLPLIADAVNAKCDAIDRIVDGVLDDPRKCDFDPESLTCPQGEDTSTCLTPKQVTALEKIYRGLRTNAGTQIYPGWLPGAETGAGGWSAWITGPTPTPGASLQGMFGNEFYKNMVFDDPDWNFSTFNPDTDVPFALVEAGPLVDSADIDLRAFKRRGGKLLMYHGWNDPAISALGSIDYFEDVVTFFKGRREDREDALEEVQNFFRLFLAPGMQHCSGGPGPNTFDALRALEEWVERGVAPDHIIASHLTEGVVDRTRPLCVYPKVAVYTGEGSTDEAENFVCRDPRGGRNDDD
jgi:feruloyl esterase